MLLVKWDYRIFWSSISLGRIKWCLTSFHGVIPWSQSSMEGSTWHCYLWLALTVSNWISWFFDPGGNKFIPLNVHCHLYFFLSNFIKFCRGPFNYIFLNFSYIYFASYFWGCHNFLELIVNSSPKATMEKICSQKCIIDQELDNGNPDDDNVFNDNNDNNIFFGSLINCNITLSKLIRTYENDWKL